MSVGPSTDHFFNLLSRKYQPDGQTLKQLMGKEENLQKKNPRIWIYYPQGQRFIV
jgi:hypothetical protein